MKTTTATIASLMMAAFVAVSCSGSTDVLFERLEESIEAGDYISTSQIAGQALQSERLDASQYKRLTLAYIYLLNYQYEAKDQIECIDNILECHQKAISLDSTAFAQDPQTDTLVHKIRYYKTQLIQRYGNEQE